MTKNKSKNRFLRTSVTIGVILGGASPDVDIAEFDYQYQTGTSNISKQTYDHRSGDPDTDFNYDSLDRLTVAEYGIQDNNEVFTMDDLGNRTKVNIRDGNDVTYSVDNLTNRYQSIADANLSYDAAGNLTEDKDGYEYEYDYENRIVKITKDPNDTVVAEFAYDALGRRIHKIDSIAGETTLYYYSSNWQVLCEYDGSNNAEKLFVYGNYIDEVLLMKADGNDYYYVHDHLYSPAALTDSAGDVIERCEYDAYGEVAIMDASYNLRSESVYGNPYYFTCRRLNILDNGNLEVYYYRHRSYDCYTGRFLQPDPIGYSDGMNLYSYVKQNPIIYTDPFGKSIWYCIKEKSFGITPGIHHAYMWDDTKNQSCGMDNILGMKRHPEDEYPDGRQPGPTKDKCTKIKCSVGREKCMMNYCKKMANKTIWIPFINDCHNAVQNAAKHCKVKMLDENCNVIEMRRSF